VIGDAKLGSHQGSIFLFCLAPAQARGPGQSDTHSAPKMHSLALEQQRQKSDGLIPHSAENTNSSIYTSISSHTLTEYNHSITYSSVSQTPVPGPVPGPGIKYIGPREILLELIFNRLAPEFF